MARIIRLGACPPPTTLFYFLYSLGGLLWPAWGARAESPVTFQVDMTLPIQAAEFSPESGDRIQVRGGFQNWTGGYWLTNSPAAISSNVYSGTFNITHLPWTPEQYRFVVVKNGDDPNSWAHGEQVHLPSNNRSFVLSGAPQVLPLVYYANRPPSSASEFHPVTFRVNMSVQRANGRFHPESGDQVEVRGNFQTNDWWTGGCNLTNTLLDPDLYSGTFWDNNAAGAQLGYKFVIAPNGGSVIWEAVNDNRVMIEPGPLGATIPTSYFENDIGGAVPVTFQVDMSARVFAGTFNPAVGDFVEVRGSFQKPQWSSPGLFLTNNPAADNTNVYSGLFVFSESAGSVEEYKFVIVSGGADTWENGANRSFILEQTNSMTLPTVFFGGLAPNEILTADTWVSFSVNMMGANVLPWGSNEGFPFSAATNKVFLNGNFLGWWPWTNSPPLEYQLTNDNQGHIYRGTFRVPKGSPILLTYNYSIDGGQNELGYGAQHARYVRTLGDYVMPGDAFGINYIEPRFGNLVVNPPLSGHVLVTWLGFPGVCLQSCTNVTSGQWQDYLGTDGIGWTNWPVTSEGMFFRLQEH